MQAGREFEMLRLLERNAAITRHIELKISESTLEPGILGIFRPVFLLPMGISNRLSDAQLKAIITHELCHVRRRDNLAATLHMLVEAVFWFHPLVWWIGARFVDERERACDEEVLKLGSDPQAYAEGILKVCEFYVESPPFCAAGVTGSNLKKRIEAIMTHGTAYKVEAGKRLLLAAMGLAAVTVPISIGVYGELLFHQCAPPKLRALSK
jgi:beta-lactamase regulating signal transducer with metallopeptidase domain